VKRDNSGSFSRNTRKEKETHPDYKGQAVIGGADYWVSGWKKDGDNGPWVSLAFELKKDKPAAAAPSKPTRPADEDWP
jgi:hypothetical protein